MGLHVDGEVAGLGVPGGLVFGVDHVLHKLPGGIHLLFVAGVDHPQRTAAGGDAALVTFVDIGEVGGAHFKAVAHVGQHTGQVGGGGQEDGGLARYEGRARLAGAAALDVGGIGALGNLLPHVEQVQRRAVLVKGNSRGVGFAPVAVVNILAAHLTSPLLEEPAVVGEQEARAVQLAILVKGGQLLGDGQDAVDRGGHFGDAGLVKGGLVVVHQGGGAVEGHGVDHAVNGVVGQQVGLDDRYIKTGFVDVGLHRHHLLGIDDEAGADFVALHDIKRQRLTHAGGLQFVDGIVILALILGVDFDFVLRGVEGFDHGGDDFRICAAQRVPEHHFCLLALRQCAERGHAHQDSQKDCDQFLHVVSFQSWLYSIAVRR